jgi:UDP-glucose 4-epimerase
MSRVIVTGAAGYIGGEIALRLHDAGHQVVGIDRRSCPPHLTSAFHEYVCNDVVSSEALENIGYHRPDAVVHCAGTSLVGPSMAAPADYYENNVVNTKRLLDFILKVTPRTRFIFSSSAAVYGIPVMTPCDEVDPREPISPYGESKMMTEQMLASYHRAYGLDYVAFRYFNACGADSQGRHGQEPGATHIIARVLESVRDQQPFVLNGTGYATPDGTCVRDYVHVQDIADAHVSALSDTTSAGVYNLGTNTGTSNREIVAAAERITGQRVQLIEGAARPGDPDVLTASSDRFSAICPDWRKHTLDDMIVHAWQWYVR